MKKEEKTLVIVESPSKSKTINKYLGKEYIIASSMGHIIDLPKSRLAVDVDNMEMGETGKIIIDKDGCIIWIWDPKRVRELVSKGLIIR